MTTERMMLQPGSGSTMSTPTGLKRAVQLQPAHAPCRRHRPPQCPDSHGAAPGCEGYPDIQAISRRLDTLYGATVGTLVRKKGEAQLVGLYADFLKTGIAAERSCFSR